MKFLTLLKRLSALGSLLAAFAFTSLHAQTVAYVANTADNTVSVINTTSNIVTGTIPVGAAPFGVALSPDGSRVYVTNSGNATVSVIDTSSNTVVATIALVHSAVPEVPGITPDGKDLYVPDNANNTLIVIDTATNTVTNTIPAGDGPTQVAFSRRGHRAYVPNGRGSSVSIFFNPIGRRFHVDTIPLVNPPEVIFIFCNPTMCWVDPEGNAMTVIDTRDNSTVTIPGLPSPVGVVGTPDGATIYVTDFTGKAVSVVDAITHRVQADLIPVGNGPFIVAMSPDGAFAYVTNSGDGTVSVIATASNTVVATIPVGRVPLGIAIGSIGAPVGRGSKSTGELHNEGVRFVLQHLKDLPPREDVGAVVVQLTKEWCASVQMQCANLSVPPNPLPSIDAVLNRVSGSQELKRLLRSVSEILTGNRNEPGRLRRIEQALDQMENRSLEELSPLDKTILLDAISVARSSAKFWAPRAEGGFDGGAFFHPSGGRNLPSDIDWGEVADADVEGCLECFFEGCVDCAVAFSVIDYLIQCCSRND